MRRNIIKQKIKIINQERVVAEQSKVEKIKKRISTNDESVKHLIEAQKRQREYNDRKKLANQKPVLDIVKDYSQLPYYDIIITISSYNRYDKLNRLLDNIFSQNVDYSYKIIILDDCSTDARYKHIESIENIIYIRNKSNNGKFQYWKTINTLWEASSHFNSKYILQIDDDFIICENFLSKLIKEFETIKGKDDTYMAAYYHHSSVEKTNQWGYKYWVDGGALYDIQFIREIDYKIDPISIKRWSVDKTLSSGVWKNVSDKLNKLKYKVHRTKYSLVLHDGNDESKMNTNKRKLTPINTKNFIDDK